MPRGIMEIFCTGSVPGRLAADAFPHLCTMDGNVPIDLEAQFYVRASNIEHRDLEEALKFISSSNYDRFPAFS